MRKTTDGLFISLDGVTGASTGGNFRTSTNQMGEVVGSQFGGHIGTGSADDTRTQLQQ